MILKKLSLIGVLLSSLFIASAYAVPVASISTGVPLKGAPLSCVAVAVVSHSVSSPPIYYAAVDFNLTNNCSSGEADHGVIMTLDLSQYSPSTSSSSFITPAAQFNTLSPWAMWPNVFLPSDVSVSNNNYMISTVLPFSLSHQQTITIGFNLNAISSTQLTNIINTIQTTPLVKVYSIKSTPTVVTINDGGIPAGFSTAADPAEYPEFTLKWCANYNITTDPCPAWVTVGNVTFTSWEQNWYASGLPYGRYSLSGSDIEISNGAVFQPITTPVTFTLVPLPGTTARMAYQQTHEASGSVNITMPAVPVGSQVPTSVVGYLTDASTGDVLASIPNLRWSTTTPITNLASSRAYRLTFNPLVYLNNTSPNPNGLNTVSLTVSSSFTPTGQTISVQESSPSTFASWLAPFKLALPLGIPAKTLPTSITFTTTVNSQSVILSEQVTANGSSTQLVIPGASSSPAIFSIPNIAYSSSQNVTGYLIPNQKTGTVSASSNNINYTYYTVPQVTGWPTGHISMGNLTGDGGVGPEGLTARQSAIDALFKYAGSNGAGDRGQVWPPIWTHLTVEEAKALSTSKGKPVIPVMVEYTAQMSGGTSYDDLNNQDTVGMHFSNLALDVADMRYAVDQGDIQSGSIVLNPDLFGMITQNYLEDDLDSSFKNNPVNISNAVKSACCMANLNPEPGVSSLTSQLTDYPKCKNASALTQCTAATGSPTIPSFTNDFAGWVAANNWIVKNFGKPSNSAKANISYGWMMNIWSADNKQHVAAGTSAYACATASATWLHFAGNSADVNTCYSRLNVSVLKQYHVYDGFPLNSTNPVPDYIAFDKYEMDVVPGAVGVGYLFNYRDWNNYFIAIQQVSQGVISGGGSSPVMLFQMPGGHIRSLNDVDSRQGHISTIPDYIFGDPLLKSDFSGALDLDGYLETPLTDGTYNCAVLGSSACTIRGYLTAKGQDWTQSNMDDLTKSNVFAILWGGGTGPTTSIALYPTDDSGWLAGKILGTLSASQ